MPRYRVVLEAQAPLLLGDGRPSGNVQSGRQFVAGSVVRGALARAILSPLGLWGYNGHPARGAPPPEPFRNIFSGRPSARFGFSYPVREASAAAQDREAFPIPLTAHTCKAQRGFVGQGGHGALDRLLGMLRRHAGGRSGWPRSCPTAESQEGTCGERLDRLRGYGVRTQGGGREAYVEARVSPRTFVRVGLNRLTETAEEGILYTLEALVPGGPGGALESPLCFIGYWTMSEDQWEALQHLLREHTLDSSGACLLRIGTARARGMGLVRLHLPDRPTSDQTLEARLDAFQPRGDDHQPLDAARLYFAVTLRAPILVYDARGQPTTAVSGSVLQAYMRGVPESLELLPQASAVEREVWTGWSPAWGLPKPVTPCIAQGSVLAFRAAAKDRAAVMAFLRKVQDDGLGERREEGWGEVVACDAWHIVLDPVGGLR